MRVGAVIVAAGMSTRMKQFKQLMKIGNLTMAERVVINFKRSGIRDIVMVTGYRGKQLEKSLEYLDIEFVENENYENTEMFESVKIGLRHLKGRCDKVLFCPADIPFFTDETVKKVLEQTAEIVVPRCGEKSGHPISITYRLIPSILSYKGEEGLKGALHATGVPIQYVDVDDPGSLMDADTREDYEKLVKLHNERLMKPTLQIGIETTRECFNKETAVLLHLIDEFGSVKEACKSADISYSKGWMVINLAEAGMGFQIVERLTGGKYGGEAHLTEKGKVLLEAYEKLDEQLQKITLKKYNQIILNSDL